MIARRPAAGGTLREYMAALIASALRRGRRRWLGPALVALLLSGWSASARAQDRFEIQVYDTLTAPPGAIGLETHVNHVIDGTTQPSADGEQPTNGQTHLTLEPHLGVTPWSELGVYIQFAMNADGDAAWGGFKLRYKMRLPRRYAHDLIGLALNVELSFVPARYEANVYGSELRPIFDISWRWLYFAFNPIIDIDLGGRAAGRPQLQPALKLAFAVVRNRLFLGAEYYAGLGPVSGFWPVEQQMHRLLGVIDVWHSISPRLNLDINFGAGYNLTGSGDRVVLKGIIGIGL